MHVYTYVLVLIHVRNNNNNTGNLSNELHVGGYCWISEPCIQPMTVGRHLSTTEIATLIMGGAQTGNKYSTNFKNKLNQPQLHKIKKTTSWHNTV